MSEPAAVTIATSTLMTGLTVIALGISGVSLFFAWRQTRLNVLARQAQEYSQRFSEMRELYTARIDTLSATVDDLESQLKTLQQQNRVLAGHAEDCERQLAQLHQRLGFGPLGGTASG